VLNNGPDFHTHFTLHVIVGSERHLLGSWFTLCVSDIAATTAVFIMCENILACHVGATRDAMIRRYTAHLGPANVLDTRTLRCGCNVFHLFHLLLGLAGIDALFCGHADAVPTTRSRQPKNQHRIRSRNTVNQSTLGPARNTPGCRANTYRV
jgi:hypothetical protein